MPGTRPPAAPGARAAQAGPLVSTGPLVSLVPVLLSAGIFAGLFAVAYLHAYTLLDGYDLGYFRQAAWLIAHGRSAFVTVRGLHLLGDHASPIFYLMAAPTRVLPPVPTLLGIQAACLAVGALPLHAICRRLAGLGPLASGVVVVAYGLFPALHNVNLADFHPEVAAVPALLGAVLFGLERRWVPYAACVAVTLLCKEDFTIVVAGLGLLLLLEGTRRAGLITVVVGLAWFVLDVKVVQPHFAGGFVQTAFLSRYGDGLGSVARFLLTHPVRVLKDLLVARNLSFVVALLAPVLFLPLTRPRYLLPAIPMQVLYLLSDRAVAHTIDAQYVTAAIPFVFVATAMALGRVAGERGGRTVLAALVAAAFLLNASSSLDGLSRSPWSWRKRDAADEARLAAVRLVPARAAVSSTSRLWPLLGDRARLYGFPLPLELYEPPRDPTATGRRATRYVVVDRRELAPDDAASQQALGLLPQNGFQVIFDREGVLALRR